MDVEAESESATTRVLSGGDEATTAVLFPIARTRLGVETALPFSPSLILTSYPSGKPAETTFVITSSHFSIGRDLANDLRLQDDSVSRMQAFIELRGLEWKLLALGSTNGCYVNGVRVETAVLRNGDMIRIGRFELRFVLTDDSVAGDL